MGNPTCPSVGQIQPQEGGPCWWLGSEVDARPKFVAGPENSVTMGQGLVSCDLLATCMTCMQCGLFRTTRQPRKDSEFKSQRSLAKICVKQKRQELKGETEFLSLAVLILVGSRLPFIHTLR